MDTLLSVLLYIHALPGPGTYQAPYIAQLKQQNMAQYTTITHNTSQLRAVMQIEKPQVEQVIIIGDWVGN